MSKKTNILELFKILSRVFQEWLKGTVMQIEKVPINDRLRVSNVSWKFHILTIYNFAVISLWNLLFPQKVAYFLPVSIVFFVCK